MSDMTTSKLYARDLVLTAFHFFPEILEAFEDHYGNLSHDVILQKMCTAMIAILFPELPYEIPDPQEIQIRMEAVLKHHMADMMGLFAQFMQGDKQENTADEELHESWVVLFLQQLEELDENKPQP